MSASNPLLALVAPGIAELQPYVPGKPISELERELGIPDPVKLASNENPLGPAAAVLQALAERLGELARYPDGSGFALRAALGARHGIAPEGITLGNGSNDVLDLVARVFLQPGTNAVFSEHAFAVYAICTQAVGAAARVAPARDFGHDLEAMRGRVTPETRVVFVANPNNPTGTWLRSGELHAFAESLPAQTMLVVDEAYFEYVEEPDYPDSSRWLADLPNLLVTRTFSKAYGLAGLRIGYGLSSPAVADLLNRVRQPFNVNALALAAAETALGAQDHVRETVALNRRGRRQLREGLAGLGLDCIPSVGNFVCVDVGRPAAPVHQRLLREGCIARPVANYGLPRHLRVSVGLEQENRRFLEALARVLRQ